MNRVETEITLLVEALKKELEIMIQTSNKEIEAKIENEIVDKVKVEEVQDALRRLTENY